MEENKYYLDREGLIQLLDKLSKSIKNHTSEAIEVAAADAKTTITEVAADSSVPSTGAPKIVVTKTTESDGHYNYTVSAQDMASATKLSAEETRAKSAEVAIDGAIGLTKGANDETRTYFNSGTFIGQAQNNTVASDIKALDSAIAALEDTVGIQWNTDDTLKTITYVGSPLLKQKLMNWIDESAKPCEVKKDKTDFAYLTNTAGVASSTNWLTRTDGTDSHYNSADKEDYLQMVELKNINVKVKTDTSGNAYAVIFNFDSECPSGFKRFLVEDSKLFARYDSTNNATAGYDICIGKSQTGDNDANSIFSRNRATGSGIYEITTWEYAVISWLMAFRYGSFDLQTALGRGIESGHQSAAKAFVNGLTDSLTTPHGKVTTTGGEAIRFMYIENPYGLRYIWCAGWRGNGTTGYFTYDDAKANTAATMATSDADETHAIISLSGTYAKNVNKLGLCSETGGSASSGFFDGYWTNTDANNNIMYVGGDSYDNSFLGAFNRNTCIDATVSDWDQRGRGALRKSVVA